MSEIRTLGPVGYNPVGEYDANIIYDRLDVVLYQGVSYVALQPVQGQVPTDTTYWDALGISGADMFNYYTKSEMNAELEAKYEKPETGIPKTDLSNSVQTSLEKADTALQSHQDISGKEDKTNKVISISSSSTDNQYASAKCVYDYIEAKTGNIETILEELDIGSGV